MARDYPVCPKERVRCTRVPACLQYYRESRAEARVSKPRSKPGLHFNLVS